eukprot:TRINITY_DN9917_c0_g1_i6.p1 TRINITY_DN9917_c0_g1~~TRINITY_DN9917_c0_g1_i6.p1  ORF type:complete len:231 (+),score=73.30 TRINITY_DN9917_c0_g1_i6:510-1202(+)
MKPDNFLLGDDKRPSTIFLIDFGLGKLYQDPRTGAHIPFRDSKRLTGTARYASIPTHMGFEQSRRDDLEGISYIMLYFLKGQLPWQGLPAVSKEDKYKKILDAKVENTGEILCRDLPSTFAGHAVDELRTMVEYCRSLAFDETPDYSHLCELIRAAFTRHELEWDYKYDWVASPIVNTETSSKLPLSDTSKALFHFNANKEENKDNLVNEKKLKGEIRQMQEVPVIVMEG